MKLYELTYLLSPDLSQEEAARFLEKLIVLVQEEGGILVDSGTSSLRRLAYPIKLPRTIDSLVSQKKNSAFLSSIAFRSEPEKITMFTQKISQEPKIIRFLLTSKKERKADMRQRPFRKPPSAFKEKTGEEKVALKEIDEKLKEILGE